ncbi:Peptidoglycan-associated lipoprotein [Nymphon striatum]|nr:Peptidoglycan-associated lipoprotein [Nymphon striatum]
MINKTVKIIAPFLAGLLLVTGCSQNKPTGTSSVDGSDKGSTDTGATTGTIGADGASITSTTERDGQGAGNSQFDYLPGNERGAIKKSDKDISVVGLNDPNNLLSQRVLYFDYNKSTIRPEYMVLLNTHAQLLAKFPELRMRLEGHADERGSREYNVALSEDRARSVKRLMGTQGARGMQMTTLGYGEELPLVSGHILFLTPVYAEVSQETVIDVLKRLDELEKKTRELHGDNEVLRYELDKLKKTQKEGFLNVDERVEVLANNIQSASKVADTVTTSSTEKESSKGETNDSADSKETTDKSTAASEATKTDGADKKEPTECSSRYIKEKEYIKMQPESPLTPNAQYWIGEIKYSHNNYKGAVEEFIKVLQKYKYSDKAPDAAIKLGYSFYALKNWAYARRTFEDVLKYFPENANAVNLAKKRLAKMDAAAFLLKLAGRFTLEDVDPRINIVMDIKTPASAESDKNLWDNFDYLKSDDEIKFVICDRDDYEWMKTIADTYDLYSRFELLVSPSFAEVEVADLAQWILDDQLSVRMQVQLHKIVWGEENGR